MQENRQRRHYRVAKKEIYEDPMEGMYVTKEEQRKFNILVIWLILLSFVSTLAVGLKRR